MDHARPISTIEPLARRMVISPAGQSAFQATTIDRFHLYRAVILCERSAIIRKLVDGKGQRRTARHALGNWGFDEIDDQLSGAGLCKLRRRCHLTQVKRCPARPAQRRSVSSVGRIDWLCHGLTPSVNWPDTPQLRPCSRACRGRQPARRRHQPLRLPPTQWT